MTKTLTERFMNNELDDRLYYFTQKMSQDKVEIGHSFEFNMVRADDGEYLDSFLIHEVLAPVPSYDKVKEMSQKIERLEFDNEVLEMAHNEGKEINAELLSKNEQLEKRLEIATNALKEYANCKPTEWMTCVTADKALKEIKEVE